MGLDAVELVLSVEELFNIEISTEQAENLGTVGQLRDFIVAELRRLGRPHVNADIVLDELRVAVCAQLGVRPEQVVPEAHFVRDLRMD